MSKITCILTAEIFQTNFYTFGMQWMITFRQLKVTNTNGVTVIKKTTTMLTTTIPFFANMQSQQGNPEL